jgi:hypothetical protein
MVYSVKLICWGLLLARILDKLEACEKNHTVTYSRFLDERQRALAERLLKHMGAARYIFFAIPLGISFRPKAAAI